VRPIARKLAKTLVAAGTAALVVAACGSSAPKVAASVLLQRAKATADAASAVHFTIVGSNVAPNGINLTSGRGDLVRQPSSIQGTFSVTDDGFTLSASIVSVGSVFEAKLPLHAGYEKTDPASLGLTNPATLLDPNTGLTNLLAIAENPMAGPTERVNGELLDTVRYQVPGRSIPVIPDLNPSQPVQMTVGIDPSNYQLRTVTMVGPFTSATSDTTYVVTLTHYNEHVTITLPPAG
jgi:hypothetical protein